MLARIRTLLFVVAIVELGLLAILGSVIGSLATFGWVVASAIVGGTIARREGARALQGWQAATARGELPTAELGERALLVLAGALLIIPGPLTDIAALSLLIPPVRRHAATRLRAVLQARVVVQGPLAQGMTGAGPRMIDLGDDDVRES